MLLKSVKALCSALGGPGSIWEYFEVLVRSTGLSGRLVCNIRTDLHFADVALAFYIFHLHTTLLYCTLIYYIVCKSLFLFTFR